MIFAHIFSPSNSSYNNDYTPLKICTSRKKAYHLFIWQSGLVLFSSLMEVPSSVTPIFYCDYRLLVFDNFFSFNLWEEKLQQK